MMVACLLFWFDFSYLGCLVGCGVGKDVEKMCFFGDTLSWRYLGQRRHVK